MEIKKSIPTIIVLIISASAFLSGFFQNDIINNSESLRSEAASLKEDLARIETKAQQIFIQNLIAESSQYSAFTDLQSLDNELALLKPTLNSSQINTYVVHIATILNNMIYIQENYLVVKLFRYFEIEDNQDPYIISDLEVEGYDFNISRTFWDSWGSIKEGAIGDIRSMVNVTQLIVKNNYNEVLSYQAQTPEGIFNIHAKDNQTITSTSIEELDFILFGPARALSQEIADKMKSAEIMSGQVQQISQAVSIITISVVLSGVMVNRINDRKNGEIQLQIQKALDIITETPEETKDYISMPVLIAAGILSIFGLIIPLLIQ